MSVTRLIDRAPVAVGDTPELIEWLQTWVDGFKAGEYGNFRSIVLLLESDDGELATISQSLATMDGARLVGLLTQAAHRKMDGRANIEALRQ